MICFLSIHSTFAVVLLFTYLLGEPVVQNLQVISGFLHFSLHFLLLEIVSVLSLLPEDLLYSNP